MGAMMHLCKKGDPMKPGRSASVLLLVLGVVAAATGQASARNQFVPNEIIVKFRAPTPDAGDSTAVSPGSDLAFDEAAELRILQVHLPVRAMDRLVRSKGLRQKVRPRGRSVEPDRTTGFDRIYRIKLDTGAGAGAEEVLAAIRSRADVEYAELNPVIAICATPDDPSYSEQWSLTKIHAPEAWDTCRGGNDVAVAIIDTGVDYNHRDLQGNLWVNEAELNGIPDIDDDGNGYVDDIHGYNFAYDTGDPADDHGHGTHCAGIVAAVGNNALDVAGVCWSVRIMAIKVLEADGEGSAADAVPAIYYAVGNGADVISGSWGGQDSSYALREAISYAHRHGVVVVTAAGNESSDAPYYPAAYPEVISVAATDSSDHRWYLSNYGSWVDIAAPGRDILSLRRGGFPSVAGGSRTVRMSGTSMAAPHVSGTCALLLSANPWLTCDEVHDIVTTSGDPIAEGICSSNSRLNMYEALRLAIPSAGTIRLDREKYTEGARVGIFLTDWNLRNMSQQVVLLETDSGDEEAVTLAEAVVSLGVFTGDILVHSAAVTPGDGVLQGYDGMGIVARYLDADDDQGRFDEWREATALVDFSPPMVLDVQVQVRGATAIVSLLTDEPAIAEIRYSKVLGGPYDLVKSGTQLGTLHNIDLSGLSTQTTYYFVVALTDEAGNAALADNAGQPYFFTTSGRPHSLRARGG